MAGVTMDVADALLKDIYGDINEQINQETPALSAIKSTSKNIEKTGGNGVVFDAHVGRNDGIGSRAEDEDLPDPGNQQYVQGRTNLKSHYAAVGLTGQVMKQASKDYQSFANVATDEVERVKKDIAKDQNRQVFGTGYGTIATIVTAGTTQTVLEVDEVKYFRGWKNRRIDIIQASTVDNPTPTYRNSTSFIKVIGWDKEASTITVDTSVTVGVGDRVIVSDRGASAGSNSLRKEWTGLSALVGDEALHNIDPANEPEWKSIILDLESGGNPQPITEDDLLELILDARESGETPDAFYTTPRVVKTYWGDLEGKRTYVNKTKLEGGMEVPTFQAPSGPISFMSDYDCPKGTLFALARKTININTNTGWEWIDEDGAMWKQVPRRDKFVAYLRNFSELTTYRRNANAKVINIAE